MLNSNINLDDTIKDIRYIIQKSFTVGQNIVSAFSTSIIFGVAIPESERNIIQNMNDLMGIAMFTLINELDYPYEEHDSMITIRFQDTNETYSCPKALVFKGNNRVLSPELKEKAPTVEIPSNLIKEEAAEDIKPEEPSEEIPDFDYDSLFESNLQDETEETETDLSQLDSSEEIDYSEFFKEDSNNKELLPENVSEQNFEEDNNSDLEVKDTVDDYPDLTKDETEDNTDFDYDSLFEDTKEAVDFVKEDTPEDEVFNDEFIDSLFKESESFVPNSEENVEEEETNVPSDESDTDTSFEEESDENSDEWLSYLNDDAQNESEKSTDFVPENRKYNFDHIGISHEGDVLTEYTLNKDNIVYSVFNISVIPSKTGIKEKILIMVAPIENRKEPTATCPIIVSAIYNGKHFTKSSLDNADTGKNLIIFDVANYHFLVRGYFDSDMKFVAKVNTTGKSTEDGTQIIFNKTETFGTMSDEKYNGLYFKINEKVDPMECFIYPLKNNESSEFVCILQTKEFTEYPYYSKTLVGTEKISIENNGTMEELVCEWDKDLLKAKLIEVTYG